MQGTLKLLSRHVGGVLCALAAATAHAAPCETPEHRQFDFWLGGWNVHTPDGKLAGVNRIERGDKGENQNSHDPGRRVRHQTWVDDQGTLLLEGRVQGNSMPLQGRWESAFDGKYSRK